MLVLLSFVFDEQIGEPLLAAAGPPKEEQSNGMSLFCVIKFDFLSMCMAIAVKPRVKEPRI